MSINAILIFQGGGSLGAYECGAYKALARHLEDNGHELKLVAGTSIGAINASIIALNHNTDDRGASALESFWKEELANPSFPFPYPFPLFEEWRRWNAVWTSLLNGHPRLFTPRVQGWNLLSPVFWDRFTHFYDTGAMERLLERHFRKALRTHGAPYSYHGTDPRLIVTAVDIDEGRGVAFDSFKQSIAPEHVVASCSLPPGFPAETIESKRYWDGGLWTNTPLPEVLKALADGGPPDEQANGRYRVYIVDVFPRRSPLPRTNWEVWGRINEITYADKTIYDQYVLEMMKYVDLEELPEGDEEWGEYKKICEGAYYYLEGITRIERSRLPYESISREIDFSPERVEQLIDQGERETRETLKKESGAWSRTH